MINHYHEVKGYRPNNISLGGPLYQRIFEALLYQEGSPPLFIFEGIRINQSYLLADHATLMANDDGNYYWASGEEFIWKDENEI